MSQSGKLPMTAESGRTRRVRPFSMVRNALAWIASIVMSSVVTATDLPVADFVLVDKSERTLTLYRDNEVLREFPIALGFEPVGDKTQEGDNKTPEGRYFLDHRNSESSFFLSIRISYPSADDAASARSRGVSPGGQIMIHGQPNEPKYSTGYYASTDWTNGCIAVSNLAMIDIWLMTEVNTPIEIIP